jgi:nitric oxide reductase NorE protein
MPDASAGPAVANSATARPRPGFPPIWSFIVPDCAGFGIFFVVFMTERAGQVALFESSARALDARLGLANTLVLITSSWLVALATEAAKAGEARRVRRWLVLAVAVASVFGVIKLAEYGLKVGQGITPLTNDFFMFYYVLTGVHFLHYAVGMAVLVVLAAMTFRAERVDERNWRWIESGAIYWHVVDLLWIFLFPMLYLLGGH